MSTLVSILLAAVLNILSGGNMKQDVSQITEIEIFQNETSLDELNPHFIITKDEMLSQIN